MGDEENPGITMLAVNDVFQYIKKHPNIDFHVQASYMEIYNEEIKVRCLVGFASNVEKRTYNMRCHT